MRAGLRVAAIAAGLIVVAGAAGCTTCRQEPCAPFSVYQAPLAGVPEVAVRTSNGACGREESREPEAAKPGSLAEPTSRADGAGGTSRQ